MKEQIRKVIIQTVLMFGILAIIGVASAALPTFVNGGPPALNATNLNNIVNSINDHGISIKDYGAIANDAVDDTTAIQAAIDAAGTKKVSLIIPPGLYITSSPLVLSSPITIIGSISDLSGTSALAGRLDITPSGGSIIQLATNSNCDIIDIETSAVHINGVCLDGNYKNQNAGNGIHINANTPEYTENYFDEMQIINCYNAGIYDEAWRSYVSSCSLFDNGYGIYMANTGHMHVKSYENHINYNGYGIYAPVATNSQRHWEFIGGSVSYNVNDGIQVGCYDPSITGGVFFTNGGDGINFTRAIGDVSYGTIIGGDYESNGKNGIHVVSSALVQGSKSISNTLDGILIDGRSCTINAVKTNLNGRNNINFTTNTGAGGRNNVLIASFATNGVSKDIYSADATNQIISTYFTTCTLGASVKLVKTLNYIVENSGTATVANGATATVVTHGLSITPDATNIIVMPTNSLGSAVKWYVSSINSTKFTINVNVDPGATTATFNWRVIS